MTLGAVAYYVFQRMYGGSYTNTNGDRRDRRGHAPDIIDNGNGNENDLIRELRRRVSILVNASILSKFLSSGEIQWLRRRWDPDRLRPMPSHEPAIAYTENKHDVYVCTRNTTSLNALMYVVIHELAHMATDFRNGHDDAFMLLFRRLLGAAQELGLYTYRPNHQPVVCGRTLTRNVLHGNG